MPENNGLSRRIDSRTALILIVLLGTFLRMWNLGLASLWVDEVNTLFAARSFMEKWQTYLPSGNIYYRARLYSVVVSLFYRMGGINEASTRAASALFGILGILLTYAMGKRFFNRTTAVLAAFMVALSGFEIGWSRVARTYTMLQLLTLWIIALFIQGFESRGGESKAGSPGKPLPDLFRRCSAFLRAEGVRPWRLLGAGLLLGATAFFVHRLTILLGAGMAAYGCIMTVAVFIGRKGKGRWLNKYSLFTGIVLAFFLLAMLLVKKAQGEILYFMTYTPPWATQAYEQVDRMQLFQFLVDPIRFPIAAFFFIGAVQIVLRGHRQGLLMFMIFGVQVFLLSFLFTHRVPAYMVNIYPLFLLTAAFGLANLMEAEWKWPEGGLFAGNPRLRRIGSAFLFFSVFLISPWLRIAFKIPFLEDGMTNLAVLPEEWREATGYALENREEGDVMIASLPQLVYYYGIRPDFGLNHANLEQALRDSLYNRNGQPVDPYVAVPCIRGPEELERIIEGNENGWILISSYHFGHDNYVPLSIRSWIEEHLRPVFRTRNGTVILYHWNRGRS